MMILLFVYCCVAPISGEGEGEGEHEDEFVTVPHLKRERRISWPAGNGRIHGTSRTFSPAFSNKPLI